MSTHIRPALVLLLLFTVVTGVAYPLVVTGLAQALFPGKANGQLIERGGKIIGSRIIGQAFSSPGYFRSRPSAAGTGYDAANSAGTNLGPNIGNACWHSGMDVPWAFRPRRASSPEAWAACGLGTKGNGAPEDHPQIIEVTGALPQGK